jgi:uncharacterized protein (DUF1778 family)
VYTLPDNRSLYQELAMSANPQRSDAVVNVRLSVKTRDLIDSAAALSGKTRTEFMLESATREAVDVLLDQRLIALEDDDFAAFQSILDNPPPASARLRQLLAEKAPWES